LSALSDADEAMDPGRESVTDESVMTEKGRSGTDSVDDAVDGRVKGPGDGVTGRPLKPSASMVGGETFDGSLLAARGEPWLATCRIESDAAACGEPRKLSCDVADLRAEWLEGVVGRALPRTNGEAGRSSAAGVDGIDFVARCCVASARCSWRLPRDPASAVRGRAENS
jgi:hypothetical protein